MPTYFAAGVTGTLSICELRAAVSNVIDFKCGPEQHTDTNRMKEAIDGANPLSERVVGGDGAANNVVQYLGAQADMPMKMVVASMRGEPVNRSEGSDAADVDETINAGIPKADAMPSSSVDSPLTSLGATPTPTQLSFNTPPLKAAQGTQQPITQITSPPAIVHRTEELPLPQLNYTTGPQCLILNINLTSKSFMPVQSEGIRRQLFDNKDLKIEVFINGELAEVDYISGRRIAGKVQSVALQYKGTRLHRQIEKPWAYMPPQVNTEAVQDAPERWSNVSEALKRESGIRGSDKYGDVPPSGEYLMALSQIALPAGISDSKGLGVVDVVITAGKGQKYGSEVEYCVGPTRMDDNAYTSLNPVVDPELIISPAVTRPSTSSDNLLVSERDRSLEIPLAQLRTRATKFVLSTPASRSQRTGEELKDSLGLNVNLKKTRVDSFENAHGRGNGRGRSLTERLGDLKKMSPQKQETEIAKLREEFGMQDAIEEPAKKKLKLNVPELGFASEIDQPFNPLAPLAPEGTMSPIDMFKPSTPTHLLTQTLTEAADANYRTQSRVELAQELGVDPNGYLMDQITSSDPATNDQQQVSVALSTPQKRTKASALANSPARVPVKVPKSNGRRQQQHDVPSTGGEWDDTPIPFSLDQPTMNIHAAINATRVARESSMLLSDGKPSRGAGRSNKKWLPSERTAAEALAEFEVPASSVGSCVTFAPDLGVAGGGGAAVGGKVQRQCGKSRKGEFREQEVVVGFRFCVV